MKFTLLSQKSFVGIGFLLATIPGIVRAEQTPEPDLSVAVVITMSASGIYVGTCDFGFEAGSEIWVAVQNCCSNGVEIYVGFEFASGGIIAEGLQVGEISDFAYTAKYYPSNKLVDWRGFLEVSYLYGNYEPQDYYVAGCAHIKYYNKPELYQ